MTESASTPSSIVDDEPAPSIVSRARLRQLAALARPLPAFLALALALHFAATPDAPVPGTRDLSLALTQTLQARGLVATPMEVHWLDPAPGSIASRFQTPSALLLAHEHEQPADVYRAEVRLSPEGRLLEVSSLYNLTETSAVDEQQLVVSGARAAWAIAGGDRYYSVQLADFGGEPAPQGSGWTWLKRYQRRLSNLQATGQLSGIGRRSFKLAPSPERLVLGFGEDSLLLDADSQRIRIDLNSDQLAAQRVVIEQSHHLARPGNLITWAVDRVRAAPWFGTDKMQWVKAIGFAGLDYFERVVGTVTGSDGSEVIKEELGELASVKPVEYTDPETGWPPPPMKPYLRTPLEGEGKWVSLENDPFIKKNPGAPSPFMFSFIRTDHKRSFSQTYVLLWDPRQVQLHAASGTQEPKTATGETGDGLVPRKVGVIDRLLAGFNGGFQATHGEFGMMAEGVVYLPPKPYAATVAKLDDGWTAFGTWPNDDNVPDEVVSFRQNMTPLMQDGEPNPYKRSWWGGTPPGWEEESRTIRSAICMTKENFVAYIYGSSLDADHLRMAAEAARCNYAIHLDMNPGHTGLEFYRVEPAGKLPTLPGKLEKHWQARGVVSEMRGWEYVGRRMIKFMALMNFPRYINRESRDFFYLTLRHILPGPEIPAPLGPEKAWQTQGLPQHGWPLAVATASLKPDPKRPDTRLEVVKLDARMLALADDERASDTIVTLAKPLPQNYPRAVWWTPRGFVAASAKDADLRKADSRGEALPLGYGHAPTEAAGRVVVAGAGIDAGDMLVYVEIMTGHERATDARLISSVLSELGCSEVVLFERSLALSLGEARVRDGRRTPASAQQRLRLVRGTAPGARRFMKDTPIVDPDVWAPLQRKRVRYFRKPKSTDQSNDQGSGSDPAATGATSPAGGDPPSSTAAR